MPLTSKIAKAFIWLSVLFFLFLLIVILGFNITNQDKIFNLPYKIDDFEVVVARYNEDLSWISKEFKNGEKIIVYNKGKDDLNLPSNYKIIKLPNIGRESHTYLYHIINNYNNLADRTLFLQGNPYELYSFTITPLERYKSIAKTKCKNIIAGLCNPISMDEVNYFLTNFKGTKYEDTIFKSNNNFREYFRKYITPDKNIKTIYYSCGANFAVDKNKILINDIEYYQRLFNTLDNIAPVEGHYIERSWDTIFGEKIKTNEQF